MKKVTYILAGLFICISIFSQNRAPSCWLKYEDNFSGDILINTVRAISPSPLYTYYCTMQWNPGMEAGGYCGMQEHPDGKNFIFSIWDPISSNDPITATYAHPHTKVENFGGEGTGLKSWNFGIGWESDSWYSFCTRAWDDNAHTLFGYWIYDRSNTQWHHLVTMDFPVEGIRFNSNTGSFIEDWLGNGSNIREVHHAEGWKRNCSDSSWYAFDKARFERVSPDDGAANYIDNYDGGVVSGYYFMKSGAPATPQTTTSGETLKKANSYAQPNFKKGQIKDFISTVENDKLKITWATDSSCTPQFKFHFELFLNAEYSGNPAIKRTLSSAHERSFEYDLSNLSNNRKYYFKIQISDIFDQKSDYLEGSFVKGTVANNNQNSFQKEIKIIPNPAKENFHFSGIEEFPVNLCLYSMSGQAILSREIKDQNTLIQVSEVQKGLYLLKINSKTRSETLKLLLK